MNNLKTTVALVDDHVLLRKGLVSLIELMGTYEVMSESDNGHQFVEGLNHEALPDLVLLDINMPVMDGYETALVLKSRYPSVRVLALSMYDNDNSIIRMLKNGARGYILKDSEPHELKAALDSIVTKGYYYSEMVTGKLIHTINTLGDKDKNLSTLVSLTEKETTFLKYVCSEKTYKEIAECMYLSPRTIDGYRDELFEKLNVKTRVGLVMYAIRNGIVSTV